eukprot:scaffold128088_cov41-Prasinocladus_malaysianus.AAC.1
MARMFHCCCLAEEIVSDQLRGRQPQRGHQPGGGHRVVWSPRPHRASCVCPREAAAMPRGRWVTPLPADYPAHAVILRFASHYLSLAHVNSTALQRQRTIVATANDKQVATISMHCDHLS